MERMAIIVEGQTERQFIEKLISWTVTVSTIALI
jgi:hypothetical protein